MKVQKENFLQMKLSAQIKTIILSIYHLYKKIINKQQEFKKYLFKTIRIGLRIKGPSSSNRLESYRYCVKS
jgi:hypothetical protein